MAVGAKKSMQAILNYNPAPARAPTPMWLKPEAQWRVAGRDAADFLPPVESSLAFHSVSPRQRMRRLLYRPRVAVSRLAALALLLRVGEGCQLLRTPSSD